MCESQSRRRRKKPSQGSESARPDGIPVAQSFFHRYRSQDAGVAELADARVSKTRSPKEYRFDPDHPHHRLAATATQRDYKGCQRGNEPGKSVNQQCEINVSHGFSPQCVRLHWRDVREAKSRFYQHHAQGRECAGERGAKLHKRSAEASRLERDAKPARDCPRPRRRRQARKT